jgi:hypothetical protein
LRSLHALSFTEHCFDVRWDQQYGLFSILGDAHIYGRGIGKAVRTGRSRRIWGALFVTGATLEEAVWFEEPFLWFVTPVTIRTSIAYEYQVRVWVTVVVVCGELLAGPDDVVSVGVPEVLDVLVVLLAVEDPAAAFDSEWANGCLKGSLGLR